MASIVATIRSNDQRAQREKAEAEAESISTKLVPAGEELPSYESLFPAPISAIPNPGVTPSLYGQTSKVSDDSVSSYASKIDQNDVSDQYQPSLWYYEPGPNPIPYEMGQRVSNPYTDSLRALQTDGDRKRLKKIVTRIVSDINSNFYID